MVKLYAPDVQFAYRLPGDPAQNVPAWPDRGEHQGGPVHGGLLHFPGNTHMQGPAGLFLIPVVCHGTHPDLAFRQKPGGQWQAFFARRPVYLPAPLVWFGPGKFQGLAGHLLAFEIIIRQHTAPIRVAV